MQIYLCESTSEEKAIQNGGNPLCFIGVGMFHPLKNNFKNPAFSIEKDTFSILLFTTKLCFE